MSAKAFADDKLIRVFFEDAAARGGFNTEYNPGAAMTGFLRTSETEISEMYDRLIRAFFSVKAGRLTDDELKRLSVVISEINAKSAYLVYYTDILAGMLLSVAKGRAFDMGRVFERLPKTDELYEEYLQSVDEGRTEGVLEPYYSAEYLSSRTEQQKMLLLRSVGNILCVKRAIMLDIADKQASLSTELALLYGGENEAGSGGPLKQRRLFLFDLERSDKTGGKPFYVGAEFTVTHELLLDGKEAVADYSILTEEYAARSGVGLYGLYRVDWVDDLIRFEFFKALENNALIRKCENCGRLFAPSGRVDTIYCGDIYENTGKTCAEIGAVKKYRDKTESDPVHEAFNKAYKRNNSRVRNNKMTQEEFKAWLVEARKKRAECASGTITLPEFAGWLGNKK